jgi:trehalose 6-phosphate phosphatase
MQVLDRQIDIDEFFRKVAAARERVLMFDYDGTLAPFHLRPHMAYPYPDVPRALDRLMRDEGTRVVIISGRRAEEIMPLLRLERQPEIWGAHGWERLAPDGSFSVRQIDDTALGLLQEAHQMAEGAVEFGARVERKPASVALHWRGLPTIKVLKAKAWITGAWRPLIRQGGLDLLPFSGGVEALVQGNHKGHAVRAVLAEAPTDSVIAYLGDDHTDEEAFREVRRRGLAVLVRKQLRDTDAGLWIRPPHELRRFIMHWCKREPM